MQETRTRRGVHIATCKKAEGGCGCFVNLGHVKESNGGEQKTETTVPAVKSGNGEGGGSQPKRGGVRKPKPRKSGARRAVREERYEQPKPKRRGFFDSIFGGDD